MQSPVRLRLAVCLVLALIHPEAPAAAQAPALSRHVPLPFAQAWSAGTPRSVAGEVAVVVNDDFVTHQSRVHHFVRDGRSGETFELRFEHEAPSDLRTGARVQFTGRRHGAQLLIAGCCSSPTETSNALQAAVPAGDQRTLVMTANFRDAAVSCSADAINSAVFADAAGMSANALYTASSLGRLTLSGRVIGPYALAAATTDACDISGWADAIDAAATASGVDVGSYPRRVYVMPPNSCPGAGLGTVGSVESSRAWIFDCATRGVFAHELGHNLGMDHAATPAQEYGDGTDPMTVASWMLPGVNAPHRHALGWLDAQDAPLVTASGQYHVAPLEADPLTAGAPRALMLPKADTGDRYYLSYRTPIGYDRYIDASYHYQLSVHRYRGDGSKTYLLAGLADGRTFADPINGITVTLTSHDSNRASVSIDFSAPCVATVPSLTLAPASQSALPGVPVNYTVTVSNHDGAACPARSFDVSDVIPPGWTSVVTPPTLTLGPGATGQAVVSLTSATSAVASSYSAMVTAADAVTAGASAPVTYVVLAPADTTAPSAPTALTASVNAKRKQITLAWTAATDDRGVAGYRVLRNGIVAGTSATTVWTDTTWVAGATYQYAVVAYDVAGNLSVPGAVVSVTLGGGTKRR